MSMYIVFCILYLYVLNYIMVSIQRRIRKKAKHDRVAQKTSLTDPSHRLISTYFIEMRYFRLLFKNSILNLFTWIEKRLKCSGPSIVLTWDDWFEGSESFSNVHSGYKILEILKFSSFFSLSVVKLISPVRQNKTKRIKSKFSRHLNPSLFCFVFNCTFYIYVCPCVCVISPYADTHATASFDQSYRLYCWAWSSNVKQFSVHCPPIFRQNSRTDPYTSDRSPCLDAASYTMKLRPTALDCILDVHSDMLFRRYSELSIQWNAAMFEFVR